jgi:transcriptional regulator with XRE-family HTH domain
MLPSVPRKTDDDLKVEDRIRAHMRQQMRERGISQAELARRMNYDASAISRVLGGLRGAIRPGFVVRLCAALKITPTRLLEEDPPQRYFSSGSEED